MEITMNLLVFCSVFILLHKCQALTGTDDGDCFIEGVSDNSWHPVSIEDMINDIDVNKKIFSGKYDNITGVGECTSGRCYFDVKPDEKKKILEIVTNENLRNIDGDEKMQSPNKTITASIQLNCSNKKQRTLTFDVRVNDTNNYPPEFEESSYEYLLPMPIPPKINLMQFGENITANDVDFSNKDMTFTSDFGDVKCTTIIQENDKFPYILHLEFTKVTRLPEAKTFKITATDSGFPSKQSSTIVTFKIDEANSEPYIPKFIQPSFMYKYNADTISITAVDEEVTLEENKENLKCDISGDLKKFFKTPEINGKIIDIAIKGQFSDDIIKKNAGRVSVECYVDSGYKNAADVTILFPEDVKNNMIFMKSTYSAQYSIDGDEQKVVMAEKISIKNYDEDAIIKVDEMYDDIFEISGSTDANSWILSKKSGMKLNDTMLQRSSLDIMISLVIKDSNRILDKAVITLLLPNGETRVGFTTSVSTGTYTFNNKTGDELKIQTTISLNSQYFNLKSAALNDYTEYFNVEFEKPNKFNIVKNKNLPQDLLDKGMLALTLDVVFTLDDLDQDQSAESALILYLSDGTQTSTTEQSTSQSSTTETSSSQSSSTGTSTSQSSSTRTTSSQSSSTGTSSSQSSSTGTSSSQSTSTGTSTSQSSPTDESTSQSSPTDESTSQTSTTQESQGTTSNPNDCDNNDTVWIIIIVVLCLILVIYVAATVFYYFKKIRNGRNFSDLPSVPPKTEPHFQKRLSHDHKLKDVSTRRPTGFIRFNPDIEEGSIKDDEEVNNNTAANKVIENPTGNFNKISESGKNVGFKDFPETESTTLSDELKKAVKERESRLI